MSTSPLERKHTCPQQNVSGAVGHHSPLQNQLNGNSNLVNITTSAANYSNYNLLYLCQCQQVNCTSTESKLKIYLPNEENILPHATLALSLHVSSMLVRCLL